MANRSIVPMASILSCLLFQTPFAHAGQTGWEIPFKLGSEGIVVQGAIGKTGGLKLTVDTGATFSLLDATVIHRLGMIVEPQKSRVLNIDTVTIPNRALVSDLRLGPVSASLYFLEADLSPWGVDGMIGLDLLRHHKLLTLSGTGEVLSDNKLTLDFESRKIRLGRAEKLTYSVPIEDDPRQIIVAARVLDRPLRLAVDTGADLTTLFRRPDSMWMDSLLPFVQSRPMPTIDGSRHVREVQLPNLQLGDCLWGWIPGLVVDTRLHAADGLLSILIPRPKILHFDFDRNIMSWNR